MQNKFSTYGGQIGFSVLLENGHTINEFDSSWDDIDPSHRVLELSIVHFQYKHSFITLRGYDWFFFENEAMQSVSSGILFHTGKIFGGVNPGVGGVEFRLEFGPNSIAPTVKKREYDWEFWTDEIKRRDSIMRQGVSGAKVILA